VAARAAGWGAEALVHCQVSIDSDNSRRPIATTPLKIFFVSPAFVGKSAESVYFYVWCASQANATESATAIADRLTPNRRGQKITVMRKTRSQTARTQAENAATSSSPGHQSTSSAPIAVNPFDAGKYKVRFRQSLLIQLG